MCSFRRMIGVGLILLIVLLSRAVMAQEPTPTAPPLHLQDLVELSLLHNPRLRQAELDIDVARGRARQAGLYPNPTLMVEGEELGGGRTGPGGYITAPMVSQPIVTGGKLRLSRAVANREVDQATLGLIQQRFTLLAAVRQGYFAVLTAQRRVEILQELVALALKTYEATEKQFQARQVAELNLIQFRVELNRFRAELGAAQREWAAAWRQLTAVMGVPELAYRPLLGSLASEPPRYDFDAARALLLELHPAIRAAETGVQRAQLALRRAQVEPIPNVNVGAGYQRDNQNLQDLWRFQVQLPVPLFDRNQGNILSARAELSRAEAEVSRVENELLNQLAAAFGQYAAAQERSRLYRTAILADAQKTYDLALAAFQGGQFEYLRVLQAQRAVAEAQLEYVRALGEAWEAASVLSGLLLEDPWPIGWCPEPAQR